MTSWAEFLLSNVLGLFFNWCWCLLLIKGESEKEWASGFESVVDPFQGQVWSKYNVTSGSSSPFLCVKAWGGDLRQIATSVAFFSSLHPSHFARSQIQRVGLPVNLRCDKACNLIVALSPPLLPTIYSLCQRTTFHGRTIPSDPPGRRKKD